MAEVCTAEAMWLINEEDSHPVLVLLSYYYYYLNLCNWVYREAELSRNRDAKVAFTRLLGVRMLNNRSLFWKIAFLTF